MKKTMRAGVILLLLISQEVMAARSYRFTGKITDIHDDTVVLNSGTEKLEFSRSSTANASRDLRDARIGDEITIWYRLDVLKAAPHGTPAQEPGQSAPPKTRHDTVPPRKKKQTIIDDRAFYDASNRGTAPSQDDSGV